MSRATELAKAEADATEAEDTPDEEEEEAEAEETPEDPGPQTEAEIEAAKVLIDEENMRHGLAIKQIMGAGFNELFVCPTCSDFALGFTFTAPEEFPLLHLEEFERCSKCNGRGRGLTGATEDAPGYTQTCRVCAGQGYVEKPAAPPVVLAQPLTAGPNDAALNLLRTQGYVIIDPPQPYAPPAG